MARRKPTADPYLTDAAERLGLEPSDYRVRIVADLARERDSTDSQTARASLTRALADKLVELRPPDDHLVSRALTWAEIAQRLAAGVEALPPEHLAAVAAVLARRSGTVH